MDPTLQGSHLLLLPPVLGCPRAPSSGPLGWSQWFSKRCVTFKMFSSRNLTAL